MDRTLCGAAFALIALSWLVVPLVWSNAEPSDAIAYVAAVRQAERDPTQLYDPNLQHWSDVTPAYRTTWCDIERRNPSDECRSNAYLSSPLAIPLTWVLSGGGQAWGITMFRLLAACCLIAGMGLIWKRLRDRSPRAPIILVISALILSPLAYKTVALGQTSPLLFVSICLGISGSTRHRRAASLVAWIGSVAFKTTPLVLAPVLWWRRRRSMTLGAVVLLVGLVAVSLAWSGTSLWSAYLDASRALSRASGAIAHNSSIASLVTTLLPGDGGGATWIVAGALGFVAALVFGACTMIRADDDTAWALAGVVWLLVTPLVWSHYLWILIAAGSVVIAARPPHDNRALWTLPGLAILVSLPLIAGAENTFGRLYLSVPISARVWGIYRPLALIAASVIIAALARNSAGRGGAGRSAGRRA